MVLCTALPVINDIDVSVRALDRIGIRNVGAAVEQQKALEEQKRQAAMRNNGKK